MRVVAITGIAIAVTALVVATSIGNGFEKQYMKALLDFNAHLMVMGPVEITDSSDALEGLEQLRENGIAGMTPFIYREALAIGGGSIRGVVVKGIDPETLQAVNRMKIDLKDAGTLADALGQSEEDGISVIAGRALADRFGNPEKFRLMIPGEGEDRFIDAHIAGYFESGIHDFDVQFILVSLPEIRRVYRMEGNVVSGFELRLDDPFMASAMAEDVALALGPAYQATTWSELNEDLLAAVHLEKLVSAIIMGIMVLVAMLNIVAVMVLTMIHRFHEVAVLKTIGLPDRMVEKIFIRGGMAVDVLGSMLGLLAGIVLSVIIGHFNLIPLDAEIYLIKSLPIDISPAICGMIAIFCVAVGYLASRIASRRISGAPIIEGLMCVK